MNSLQIKMAAFILMAIDHAGALFLPAGSGAWMLARGLGRIAFPLYAYLAGQGIQHTRDIRAYAGRLLFYAVLSEAFFDMAFFGTAPSPVCQNTFFTLTLAVAAFWSCHTARPKRAGGAGKPEERSMAWKAALPLLCAGAAAEYIHADYGLWGVFLVGVMASVGRHKAAMAVAVWCFLYLSAGWLAPDPIQRAAMALAVTAAWAWLTCMDNGEPGDKRLRKWFYAAYPAHLIALWLLRLAAAA